VPLPSAAEQTSIAEVLGAIDLTLATEGARLAKLQRLKTGLMQNLLSGRVLVAELAEKAPLASEEHRAKEDAV
jgi:type I restriction enzyme S subunit